MQDFEECGMFYWCAKVDGRRHLSLCPLHLGVHVMFFPLHQSGRLSSLQLITCSSTGQHPPDYMPGIAGSILSLSPCS